MNEKIIFVRTDSGEDEARNRTALLSKDIKRALLMVDGTASVAEIMKRSSPSLRGMLADMFAELVRGGFIQDKAKPASSPRPVLSAAPKKSSDEVDELDFTAAYRVPTQTMLAEEAAKVKAAEQARVAAEERDAAQRLAREEAARVKAEQEAAEAKTRAIAAERARVEAEEARVQAEARAKEQARLQAEAARVQAERLAREAAARVKAEQQAVEAQARARAEAERHAKAAVEAARKAEQQAAEEQARAAAAEKARLEAEVTKLKAQAEAEARARVEADLLAKREAEAARVKAEQEVIRVREEVELARQRAAAEAREEALRIAKQADAARQLAEQEAAEAQARERAEAARHASEVAATARRAEQHAAQVKAEADAQARAVAEEKNKLEAEVAALKAHAEAEARAHRDAEVQAKREAEAARVKAEQEVARVRQEVEQRVAEARVREEDDRRRAEAARELAEQEAARIRAAEQVAADKLQAERGARELAERVKAEQETERLKASESAHVEAATRLIDDVMLMAADTQQHEEVQTNAQMLAAVVRLNAKHAAEEESVFSALDELTKQQAAAAAATREWVPRSDSPGTTVTERRQVTPAVKGCDSRGGNNGVPVVERRTTTAAVLFFDIVGYTKQPDSRQLELKQQFNQLVTNSLASLDAGERIILDTGDGAAIGFLQHPTDALESAIHFRASLLANKHFDYPDLRVRIGIHLGPVSLVKDMNGQINMLGDGINSAQRVMSFAGKDQIYVSRAFFEFVANLSDEYQDLFRYRGGQQDKHGREHQVYELLCADTDESVQAPEPSNNLGAFSFEHFDAALSQPDEPEMPIPAEPLLSGEANQLFKDVASIRQEDTSVEPVNRVEAVREAEEAAPQYSDAEARQLADAQAKKWQEAELRAAELARQKAESVPKQAFQQPLDAVPVEKSVARPRRKPVSWGKLAAGLAALLVVALFVVPLVLPTQGYVASIEQVLGAKLQQPVHVGHLSGRILPTPHLLLSDVYIGEEKQIQARQAQVNFAFPALFGSVKSIASIELDGVQVNGAALMQVSGWLQQTAADPRYPIRHIALTQVQLDADGIQFSDVDGELDFDAAGKFTQASLNANGHKLALEIRATPEQKLALTMTLRDSALPLLPNWIFEELKAVGELSRDELRITELDSRVRGGVLTGDARINWRSGWRVQGALVAKVIPLQNINKLLTGDLDGTARFQMQAANLAKLADAAVLNGVFSVKKGIINGVDIVETTRLRSRESLPGGRTHFDELSGELSYANDSYRFSQLKMNAAVVKAGGTLIINRQALSGSISADLTMRAGAVALQVGGTTESPSVHVAH
ncbi:MAG: adenylate/guanylate cyclase domain-containing protein [Gallionella sp.]|jgi:hypothetical protein